MRFPMVILTQSLQPGVFAEIRCPLFCRLDLNDPAAAAGGI